MSRETVTLSQTHETDKKKLTITKELCNNTSKSLHKPHNKQKCKTSQNTDHNNIHTHILYKPNVSISETLLHKNVALFAEFSALMWYFNISQNISSHSFHSPALTTCADPTKHTFNEGSRQQLAFKAFYWK